MTEQGDKNRQDQDDPHSVIEANPEKYAYSLYPERRGKFRSTFFGFMFNEEYRQSRLEHSCQKTVVKAMKEHPILKIMVAALKKSGCGINLARHVCCEYCYGGVTGGFDPITSQIVVCANNTKGNRMTTNVLAHELIHMYDYCVHQMDFTNPEHVACTEIRAANITYCSYLSAIFGNHIPSFTLKERHQQCVRNRAVESLTAARDISMDDAKVVVDKVFNKCYRDQEPIGRRPRKRTSDCDLAYTEGFIHGYD